MGLADQLWTYEGRLDRRSWWVWTTALLGLQAAIALAVQAALGARYVYVTGLVALLLMRVHTALATKRLRDQERGPWLSFWWCPAMLVLARPDRLSLWRDGLLADPTTCDPTTFYGRWAIVLIFAAIGLWMVWRLGFSPSEVGFRNSGQRRRLG